MDVSKMSTEELEAALGRSPSPPAMPAPAPAAPQDYSKMATADLEKMLGRDPTKPDYIDGSAPERAINQSPLSALERRSIMGVGNKEGQAKRLGELFPEGVTLNQDTGDFRVKKDGTWRVIDAKTFDGKDAWELSKQIAGAAAGVAAYAAGGIAAVANTPFKALGMKGLETDPAALAELIISSADEGAFKRAAKETVSEVAENETEIASAALGIGAAVATGGASLAAQAGAQVGVGLAAKAVKTYMGRAEGTFEQSDEDTLKDTVLESLLIAGGTIIPAGVRPGAQFLAKTQAVKKMAEFAAKASEPVMNGIYNTWGTMTGLGGDVTRRMFEHGRKVQGVINTLAGQSTDGQILKAVNMKADKVEEIARAAKAAGSSLFRKNEAELLKNVDPRKSIDASELTDDWITSLSDSGIVRVKPLTDAKSAKRIIESTKNGQTTYTVDNLEMVPFEKFSSETLKSGSSEEISTAVSKESYDEIAKLFEVVQKLRTLPAERGAEGVKRMMAVSRALSDLTYKASELAKTEATNPLLMAMTAADKSFKTGVTKALGGEASAAAKAWKSGQSDYALYKDSFEPVFKALDSKNVEAITGVANRIASQGSTGAGTKEALEKGLNLLRDKGLAASKQTELFREQLKDIHAAEVLIRESTKGGQKDTWRFFTALGLSTVNLPLGAIAMGGIATTSTKVPKTLMKLSYGTLDLMRNDPGAAQKLLLNPFTSRTLTTTAIEAQAAEDQTRELLMQQVAPQQ